MSVLEEETSGKTLVSLKNVAAERYWDMRWQREWQTKYHNPSTVSYVTMLTSFRLFRNLAVRSEVARRSLDAFPKLRRH